VGDDAHERDLERGLLDSSASFFSITSNYEPLSS
jgi:hypothetical protein